MRPEARMTYRKPHFLDCNCQCESKRHILQALLTHLSLDNLKLSISEQSFLLIYSGGQGPKPSHNIQYNEYQCIGLPAETLVMEHFQGNLGDLYIDKTPGNHALYAKTSATQWEKWPGPRSITNALRHPLYPHYVLWCHPSTRTIGWFFDLLVNKHNLGGSTHDIIYAILEERREAEAIRKKQLPAKRRSYPSEGQEVAPARKYVKWTTNKALVQNDSQVVNTTKYRLPPTIPITTKPTSNPQEEIARLEKEAVRLKNAHTALQKLVTTTYPIPSLAPDRSVNSQPSVLNLLDNPRQLPHSSPPDGNITVSRPGPDSRSPNPLRSDIPPNPPPPRIPDLHNEDGRNPKMTADNGDSESMDIVLTMLDPEKEANDNVSSSVNAADVVNHDTRNESVIADDPHKIDALDTYEHNSLAQETGIDPPSNGVDRNNWITDEPDERRDIDTEIPVESTAKGCIPSVIIPPESSELSEGERNMSPNHPPTGSKVEGNPGEGASHVTTETSCLDLQSDNTLVTTAVATDHSPTTCSQPSQRVDPPTTTSDIVMKDPTPPLSNEHFRLNFSLKQIIFHMSRNSEVICRLCLGTDSSRVQKFSMDVPLEDLGDHCVKEHPEFCEVLGELSAEELDGLKRNFSTCEH